MCGRIKLSSLNETARSSLGIIDSTNIPANLLQARVLDPNAPAAILVRSAFTDRPYKMLQARWGLEFRNHHPIRFARSESASTVFAENFRYRRCILMVSGWWERDVFVFASGFDVIPILGIWGDTESGGKRFALLSRAAPHSIAHLHSRAPLIGDLYDWLRTGVIDLEQMTSFNHQRAA